MGTLDRIVVQVLPHVPRSVVRRVSARYIAGARLEDALATVADLNRDGVRTTADVLGEFIRELSEAERATNSYLDLLNALDEHRLDSQVSVKLTALGLQLDKGACLRNLRRIVRHAERLGNFATVDMEDSSCTDSTLELFTTLRRESSCVGAVLQACLRRSRSDLERLLPLAPNIRICKGIYIEPAGIAFLEREAVRTSFLDLVDAMLGAPRSFVGIATHDERLVRGSLDLLDKHAATKERYEFQMLLGVREELRAQLLRAGHPVRVYVPYGEHWYAYSMRRLKENPAIAGHVLRNILDRRHGLGRLPSRL